VGLATLCAAGAWPQGVRAQQAEPPPSQPAASDVSGIVDVDQEGDDERAKAHFQVGKSLYDSGRFSEAAEEWEKAYDLSGRAELLYNIYVAHRDATEMQAAIAALQRYLEGAEIEPARRINLEARLRAMQSAQAEAGAPQAVVEPEPASEPEPEPEPAPAPDAALRGSSDDATVSPIISYGLIGLGGSMVVGAVVTGILAQGKIDDVESACPNEACPFDFDLDGTRNDAQTLALVTDVLWIGGAIAAGAGVTLLLLEPEEQQAPAAPTASLRCGPLGCSVSGSF
jgi:tetratricopeptide (TPR) repeat protein